MGRGEAKSSIYLFEWLGKQASKSYKYQVFTVTLQRFFPKGLKRKPDEKYCPVPHRNQ
jgi:hypothetical protein